MEYEEGYYWAELASGRMAVVECSKPNVWLLCGVAFYLPDDIGGWKIGPRINPPQL